MINSQAIIGGEESNHGGEECNHGEHLSNLQVGNADGAVGQSPW